MPEQPHVSFPTYFLRAHRLFDSISPPSCLPDSLFMASTENPPIVFVHGQPRCYEAGGGGDSSKHVFHYKDFRCEKAERFLLGSPCRS
ncbi:PREDICTED: uncharacterized protein LOC106313589 isoform X4 [Brassica oleracea var. oleracea]|uniref:uncharacterized protein LOC106313589 isoform X4 n=1 Tax=Brassica oleracea var. oleracea TaxID=109376 RepID=UPI0006A6FEB5|nr:PREDICTED: uncharacterized protein LOC106313589 isoform X4 [Brassica oleracea var. oleracea]